MPPLTCKVSPVIYEACSDDKKTTELATSSPFPSLDIGILEVKTAFTLSTILSVILDCINPGETQFNVIFFFAYSIAKILSSQ